MKNLMLILISLMCFCCNNEIKEQKTFGAEGNPDEDFAKERGKPIAKRDTDRDGINDANDGCITQPETYNGYQDSDGCPDTAPPPPPVNLDTDGDGILNNVDSCPTQKETFNGYQDIDGCPDTLPTIPPPVQLPSSVSLVTPVPQSQGSEGACHAFAVVWVRSIENYYKTGQLVMLSPEYLFNQTKASNFDGRDSTNCGSSALITNLKYLTTVGVCTWSLMPYSWTNGCSNYPNAAQKAEAANYKISNYLSIPATDIIAIKTELFNKHALAIQITVDNGFYNAGPDFIWKTFTGAIGSHGVYICGYDDSKNAFKVGNSWGIAWGDKGYSWIDYSFLKTISSSAFELVL